MNQPSDPRPGPPRPDFPPTREIRTNIWFEAVETKASLKRSQDWKDKLYKDRDEYNQKLDEWFKRNPTAQRKSWEISPPSDNKSCDHLLLMEHDLNSIPSGQHVVPDSALLIMAEVVFIVFIVVGVLMNVFLMVDHLFN